MLQNVLSDKNVFGGYCFFSWRPLAPPESLTLRLMVGSLSHKVSVCLLEGLEIEASHAGSQPCLSDRPDKDSEPQGSSELLWWAMLLANRCTLPLGEDSWASVCGTVLHSAPCISFLA